MWGFRGEFRGFTLIEVVMAVAAMAFLVLGIYQLPGLFAQQGKQMATVVTRDRIFKSFAQRFIQVAEKADVAMRFQYLPISTSCVPNSPCIRRLEDGKELKDTSVSGVGTSIQFFSDEEGELTENNVFEESSIFSPIKVQSRKPLNLDSSVKQTENYATWPLVSAASEPFVLLTRSELNDYFFLVDEFKQSAIPTRWVIVEGIRPGVPTAQLQKRPMVIYNTNDFAQYFVQKVKTAIDCTTTDPVVRQHCIDAARANKPAWDPGANQSFFSSRIYALELEEFSPADLVGYLPTISPMPSSWGSQTPGLFLFPTHVISLSSHSTSSGNITLNAALADIHADPADAKRFGHMQDLIGSAQGRLALLPVDLVNYFLKDELDLKGKRTGKMTLHSKTLGTDHDVRVLEDISDGNSVVFIRRLGTSEIGVFHFE